MATKILVVVILGLIGLTTIFSTCKKGLLGCANTVYYFKAAAQEYHDNDSIPVGDTVWIEFNLPTSFIDLSSNKQIDYSNSINFGNFIRELKFTGGSILDPGTEYSPQDFKYILIVGNPTQNNFPKEGQAYNFSELNNSYKLKVGLIPTMPGIYALSISDADGVYRKGDECTKAHFYFQLNNTNQHLYLYQNNRPGYQISDYERAHLYCFKVY
jgi:hypothetical protein